MGRPERRLDPEASPLQRFAFELRQLRQQAGGLSYRQLAKRAHYSATALSEAAAGEQLPSLAVTLAYVQACGGDRDVWEVRWQALAAQVTLGDDETGGAEAEAETKQAAPYMGLAAFQPEDADRFFGRNRLIDELARRLAHAPFLAVFGASGSGKSSLLRAGLLPAMQAGRLPQSQDWPTVLLTPGRHPLEELAIHVAALHGIAPGSLHTDLLADPGNFDLAVRQALAAKSPTAQLLLVVDQFEEIFTLCPDGGERATFVDALLAAVAREGSRARVVLGIRADFYGRCADYPALVAALRDAQVLIGPMNQDELRDVIIQPATRAGFSVERALVATLLADVEGRPGALPLLSHTLLETWRRRRGRTLTLAGYEAAGGVRGAIAQTAEQLYGQLNPHQQAIAENVFVRLTALGEGTEDTRRRVHRAELLAGPDSHSVQTVLDRLVQERLVILGADSVEVAHEALIREWPRLRKWLVDDRDSLRLHRRLTEAAIEWDENDREEGFLYRGARLAAWQDCPVEHLNTLERTFLDASQQRQASEHASNRRRTRLTMSVLSLALVAISVLALLAAIQRNRAGDQRDLALAHQLATNAAAQLSIDPELSLLLAREAFALRPILEAETVLRQATLESRVRATLRGHDGPVWDVAFNPDGHRMVSAGTDGTVRIWDPASGDPPLVLRGHDRRVGDVTFSPNGQRVASAGYDDRTVQIWDPTGGRQPVVLRGHAGSVTAVAFSPDGQQVASTAEDGTVRIWDPTSGANLMVLRGHVGWVSGVAFSPDGRRMASAGGDGTVRVWDLTARNQPVVLRGHAYGVDAVAFSPDGQRVVSVGDDSMVRIWDPTGTDQPVILRGHNREIKSVVFSPDGQWVASAGYDGTVRIWDLTGGNQPVVLRGHKGPVYAVAFSPDGQRVTSAGEDSTVRIWDLTAGNQPVVLRGHEGSLAGGIAFSPNGHRVTSAGDDGTVRIWDSTSGANLMVLRGHDGPVYAATFSPDGQRVTSAGDDGTVRIWNPANSGQPLVLRGHDLTVFGVAFRPDGQRVASASGDRTVRIWEPAGSGQPLVLRGHDYPVYDVVFSFDGQRVASVSDDGTVRIWDPTSGVNLMVLRGHDGPVRGVAFSPDGQRVASAGDDGTVRLWDPTSGANLKVLRGHNGPVGGVAFSPDGQRVASASGDSTVRIWDPTSGTNLVVFRGHNGPVHGVAFGPDGQRLVSASDDATARVWQCEVCGPIDKVLVLAEKRSTRALTSEERETFLHHS